MINEKLKYYFVFLIFILAILPVMGSCLRNSINDPPKNIKEVCDEYCYGQYELYNTNLEGVFIKKGDSLYIATFRKLRDINRLSLSASPLETSAYYIGSYLQKKDTVELKRKIEDISIPNKEVLEYQTFIYPSHKIDSLHFYIKHKAISTSPIYQSVERIFYFKVGQICPDSIFSNSEESNLFIYD